MKIHEIKFRLVNGVNGLIDQYFGQSSVPDRFINRTLKVLVHQNAYKVDRALKYFADENGDIDENYLLEQYGEALGDDGFVLDLRDYVGEGFIRSMLPNRALRITRQDLSNLFGSGQDAPPQYE